MFLPIASAIASGAISVVMLGGYALAFRPEVQAFMAAGPRQPRISQPMWIFLFLFYPVNYFIVIYFNVALVSAASDRLAGGAASIDEGLHTAWERKGKIFQWALLAATVGILLRSLEERLGWLGRLGVRLFGVAWTLGSYFVVPVLAAEDVSPVEALYQSAQLISETWGEEIAGSFSFGLFSFSGASRYRAAVRPGQEFWDNWKNYGNHRRDDLRDSSGYNQRDVGRNF